MISEPHPTVRRMLVRMVARLGYEPVALDPGARPTPARLRSADALLIEPDSSGGLALARVAHAANPSLAIVCEGSIPPGRQQAWRRTDPAGQLAKPFTIDQLDAALQQGFACRDSAGDSPALPVTGEGLRDRRAA